MRGEVELEEYCSISIFNEQPSCPFGHGIDAFSCFHF